MASEIRKGFWEILHYDYRKEPQNSIGTYLGPYIMVESLEMRVFPRTGG